MSETPGSASAEDCLLTDRYELGELVGRGGMAEVYRAHDLLLERTVAVKIFRAEADHAPPRRFDDEAHALARLEHPALVSIFDIRVFDGRPCLVMEFVEGTSLQSRLLTGPLPPDQVRQVGGVLAEALDHAHSRGVVHRDVKPSNIVLGQDDLPHLTDFGIALLAGAARLTCADEIVGTPAYLAPEQLLETEIGPPADVYALALVLLECLTGEVEYPAGTNTEVALARLNRPPRIPAGLPPTFADLLTAMTSTEPRNRPTARECALGLLAPSTDPATTAVLARLDPITPEPVEATTRMPGWRLLTASLAGIVAVVVTLMFLLNGAEPLTGRTPVGGSAGHAGSNAGAGTGGGAGSPGAGPGATGHTRTAGTLVANELTVAPVAPTSTPTAPSTSAEPSSTPATTSPTATSPTAPSTTTSADPPTTSGSAPSSPSSIP